LHPEAIAPMSIPQEYNLSEEDVTRLIGMAWEDDVPFAAIEAQYGVPEDDVIALMRRRLKRSSWELWRERVSGRPTKHQAKQNLTDAKSRRPPNGRPVADPSTNLDGPSAPIEPADDPADGAPDDPADEAGDNGSAT
jgi:uncharacterized protein (TIGR03643 family)